MITDQILISWNVHHRAYEVIVDGKTTGAMAWEEMLGQVATLTHSEIRKPRFEMETPDEWQFRHGRWYFWIECPCDEFAIENDEIPY